MYLEISGRRSGKTTRVIEKAYEYLDQGLTVRIYGVHSTIYPDELRDCFFSLKSTLPEDEVGKSGLDKLKEELEDIDVVLVDEFEWLKIPIKQLDIENWHLYGTPTWESDNVKYLLTKQPIYCRYTSYDAQRQMIENKSNFLTTEMYRTEVFGEFEDDS